MTKQVVFELPDDRTPGYLRRMKAIAEFQESQTKETNPINRFEKLVAFVAAYVVEPEDKAEAYEALLDASKEDIDKLFALITGKAEIVPPEQGASLETTTPLE
jgi:hypothetical protein